MIQIITMNSELYNKFAKIIRQDHPIHIAKSPCLSINSIGGSDNIGEYRIFSIILNLRKEGIVINGENITKIGVCTKEYLKHDNMFPIFLGFEVEQKDLIFRFVPLGSLSDERIANDIYRFIR